MPIYSYKAIDRGGKTVRGQQTAANELDLETKLKEVEIDLLNARVVKERGGISFGGVKPKDKIMLCVHLQQLDKAGVPILDSLSDLRETTESAALRQIMSDVYESVRTGSMLSVAMGKHPKTFDEIFTGLVAAGEKTGNLSDSFTNLAEHLKWSEEIRRKVKKAITYPIFTLLVVTMVIMVMMTQVVPQLKQFLEAQGQEIPVYTKALLSTSEFIEMNWWLFPLILIIFTVGLKMLKKTSPGFLRFWDNFKLHWPLIGPTIRKIDLARFTRFFGVLYTRGIDILDCLKVGQQVVRNKVIVESIEATKKMVSEGSSLTAALKRADQFPGLVIRMFKVGEDSGNMKESLENINFFYDREVNDTVDLMVGAIKPIMTIMLGVLIMWIAIAMFGPIYGTIEQMQSQL